MSALKVICEIDGCTVGVVSSWTSPFVGERVMISHREDINGRPVSILRPYRVSRVIHEGHGPEAGSKLIAIVSVKPEKISKLLRSR